MYCKAKKNSERSEKFWKFLFLKIYFLKKHLKGGISIYADFGPPNYVLWCCVGICHEVLTFFRLAVAILWVDSLNSRAKTCFFIAYFILSKIRIASDVGLFLCNHLPAISLDNIHTSINNLNSSSKIFSLPLGVKKT